MSSPFPQVRLHGDKEAAAQHVRRAMGELFRTEMIKERAGVPILKRTIPVDSHNTIEVQISKEQTFVNIISIPPEEGEEIIPVEEEEFNVEQCPPGFIVRKLTWDERWPTDSLNQTKYKGDGSFDGYPGKIIAYDGKQWRQARYDEANLGAFEGATNCGWWHLGDAMKKKKIDQTYNGCDLITWEGGHGGLTMTTKMYSGAASTGQESIQKVSGKCFLSTYFYHGGKKIDGPGNIICVCIAKENGVDYYYAVWVNLTTQAAAGGGTAYHTVSGGGVYWVSRRKVGLDGDAWEYLYNLDPQDPLDNDSPWVRPHYDPSDGMFHLPWGTGYCDDDGNAYFQQLYYGQRTVALYGGKTEDVFLESFRLIKLDLRSGKAETVGDMMDGVIVGKSKDSDEQFWGGPWTYNAPPAEPTAKTAGSNDAATWDYYMEDPCFVGLWGGGQDMYTYWLEPFNLVASATGSHISVPSERYEHHYVDQYGNPKVAYRYTREDTVTRTEVGSGTMVLTCYKMKDGNVRGTKVDQLTIFDQYSNINLTHKFVEAAEDYKRNIQSGGWDGNHEQYYMAAHVMDHNPEIKNSWEYTTRENWVNGVDQTGRKRIAYYRDGKTVHSDEVQYVQGPLYTTTEPWVAGGSNTFVAIGPSWYYSKVTDKEIWWSPGGLTDCRRNIYVTLTAEVKSIAFEEPWLMNWVAGGTEDGYRTGAVMVHEIADNSAWYSGFLKMADINWSPADYRPQPGWGHRIWAEYNQPEAWPLYHGGGNGTMMTIAQASINQFSDNKTLYRPTQFAVHRKIEGLDEKPYIRMRRKIRRHPTPMSGYALGTGAQLEHPHYTGSYGAAHGWDKVYDSLESTGPSGEEGKAVSSAHQYNGWFSNYLTYAAWRWWMTAPGNAKEGYNWDDWEIDCNFASKDELNEMVGYDEEDDKGAENMFFEIAVL